MGFLQTSRLTCLVQADPKHGILVGRYAVAIIDRIICRKGVLSRKDLIYPHRSKILPDSRGDSVVGKRDAAPPYLAGRGRGPHALSEWQHARVEIDRRGRCPGRL